LREAKNDAAKVEEILSNLPQVSSSKPVKGRTEITPVVSDSNGDTSEPAQQDSVEAGIKKRARSATTSDVSLDQQGHDNGDHGREHVRPNKEVRRHDPQP